MIIYDRIVINMETLEVVEAHILDPSYNGPVAMCGNGGGGGGGGDGGGESGTSIGDSFSDSAPSGMSAALGDAFSFSPAIGDVAVTDSSGQTVTDSLGNPVVSTDMGFMNAVDAMTTHESNVNLGKVGKSLSFLGLMAPQIPFAGAVGTLASIAGALGIEATGSAGGISIGDGTPGSPAVPDSPDAKQYLQTPPPATASPTTTALSTLAAIPTPPVQKPPAATVPAPAPVMPTPTPAPPAVSPVSPTAATPAQLEQEQKGKYQVRTIEDYLRSKLAERERMRRARFIA